MTLETSPHGVIADESTLTKDGNIISVADDGITSAKIDDDVIVNADINSSASIDESKLAFNTSTGHSHDGSDSTPLNVAWVLVDEETKADSSDQLFNFTSIASGFRMFMVVGAVGMDTGAGVIKMHLNGDSGSNYNRQIVENTDGTTLATSGATSGTNCAILGGLNTAERFMPFVIYITNFPVAKPKNIMLQSMDADRTQNWISCVWDLGTDVEINAISFDTENGSHLILQDSWIKIYGLN